MVDAVDVNRGHTTCHVTVPIKVRNMWRVRLGLWLAAQALKMTGVSVMVEDWKVLPEDDDPRDDVSGDGGRYRGRPDV